MDSAVGGEDAQEAVGLDQADRVDHQGRPEIRRRVRDFNNS